MKQVVKALRRFIRAAQSYALLAFALLVTAVAGVLQLLHQAGPASLTLVFGASIALIPTVVRMIRDIQAGRYGVDILAALAIGTAIVLRQYWAAIVIVIMLSSGKALEDFASNRARSELRDLLRRAPQHAHVLRRGKQLDVVAGEVMIGDLLSIRPGETVPVDAVVVEGTSDFDESSLTGESALVTHEAGSTILSGSVNGDSVVTARAIHTAASSQYQQIVRLVQAAAEHPAPFVRLADRYSIPFTVIALTIGGMAWILSHQPIRFLEVLVVATPCPLILATPIALIAGMSRAARDGIIIKTGTALEVLAQAKTFAFDKTGTLTYGQPKLDKVVAFQPYRQNEVLAWAAAVEQHSNHVLAAAITNAALAQSLKLPKMNHSRELAGHGLEAHAQGKDILVGRLSLLASRDIKLPKQFDAQAINQTAAFVAIDGVLAGYLTFQDIVRPEAKSTLAQLRLLGIRKTLMVTGDRMATAKAIGKQLGLTDIAAETLPSEKLRAIEHIQERPVAFVGDGVNDAPVLMAADVGIALGARGSTAASESADIVIMKDTVSHVVLAVRLAKRSFRIATQSILIGIGLSVALMGIFATGKFSPIAGAVTQEVVDILVILNALRAHRPLKPSTR